MLDAHAAQLDSWLGEEKLSLTEARERLAKLGAQVSVARLRRWQRQRESQQLEELLLDQIARGARLCARVERQLRRHPAPGLETLIQLHRVLVLKFSLEADAAPGLLRLVKDLMKPVLEWERLLEERKGRDLAERKHRDQVEARKIAGGGKGAGGGLTRGTLEKIERELNLL